MEPFHVVGAGGIGCAVGYALCAAGASVVFIDANPDKVRWGREHGVAVDRLPALAARFVHFEEWRPEPNATVLLCTKCYDNAAVLARLPADVRLIPIQNGFDPALQPGEEDIEGIASFISECPPDRPQTRITRRGKLHLGSRRPLSPVSPTRKQGNPLLALRAPFWRRAPFRVVAVPNILPYKYTKLMYNAAISPLAAAAGLDNGQLLSVPPARRLFFALLRENYAILKTAGIPLARIGPFHPQTVNWILHRLPVARFLSWVFYPTLRKTYCSMAGDLPHGRTEIDYYNRHLIELAGACPCPLNRHIYELIKRMERQRLTPGRHVLNEMEEARGRTYA